MPLTLKFHDYVCHIERDEYQLAGTALRLIDSKHGEPIANITVWLCTLTIPSHAFIKDYAENEGMLKFLDANKLIKRVISTMPSGHATIPLVELDLEEIAKYSV